MAAKRGDVSLVKILLAERADPSQVDSAGNTALEVAQQAGAPGCNDILLGLLQSHIPVPDLKHSKVTVLEVV